MFDRMSRQFEDMTRSWEGTGSSMTSGWGSMGIDLADRGDEFVVTADVPGFEKDEIDLQLVENTLRIHAEHTQETEQREETYLRSERQHQRLSDSVRLPEAVDEEAVTATCKNGVLTVHLPKAEPSQPSRNIEVE